MTDLLYRNHRRAFQAGTARSWARHPSPPHPTQRTAGPRSAGRIDRPDRSERRDAGRCAPHGMRDGPAVWRYRLSFSGRHSSVGRTPYGATPLKRLVSEHEPSALHRAHSRTRRGSAPPARDPLAGSSGATGGARRHGLREIPAVCGTGLSFSGARSSVGRTAIWRSSNPETPRQRAREPSTLRGPTPRPPHAPPVRDPLAGATGDGTRGVRVTRDG